MVHSFESRCVGVLFLVLGLGIAWPAGLEAQMGGAHFRLDVRKHYELPARTTQAITGPLDSIQVEVTLENQRLDRPFVIHPGLFKALRWEIVRPEGPPLTPIDVEWRDEVRCGSVGLGCNHDSVITLAPEEFTKSLLTLRFDGPQLVAGEYWLGYMTAEASPLLREMDGSTFQGSFLERGSVPLTVVVPTSPEELVQHYRSEASAAMIQRDFSTALEAFQAMAKVQPTNPEGIAGIGLCLLTLRRYQEAADALATALAMQPNVHGESALPGSLALAYAVLGKQADAEAVLKAHFGERAPVILTGVLEAAQKLRARAPRR